MTPENARKKAFLERYKWYTKELDGIDRDINRCILGTLPGSPLYDGMPRGSGRQSDMSDYAVEIEGLIALYSEMKSRRIKALRETAEAIEAVEEDKYRILLNYKYIHNKTWKEIADAMGYVPEYVRRELHSEALNAFKIP